MQKLLTSLAGTTVAAVLLAGCAQVPPNAGENPSDPYERVNRNIYAFNDSIDRALFRPVAETYVEWTPEWVRTRVSNVVDNLGDPGNAVNNTLQGKVDRGIESLMRFLVNSTFGIAGIFEVADEIGLKRHSEDFGQTLGVWGVGSGSYLVLPILGPSSTRDWTRWPVSIATDPLTYALWNEEWYWSAGATTVALVDGRARLLKLDALRASTIDEYAAVRDAYLAKRASDVRDGAVEDEAEELQMLTPLPVDNE